MRRRSVLPLLVLGPAALVVAACGGGGGSGASDGVPEVARDAGLGQFLRAVRAAGLEEYLAGPGPFTVFAPSEAAFRARPSVLRGSQEEMQRLVGYHVVPGDFGSGFLEGIDANYSTLAGRSLHVDGRDGLRVNGARVIRPDLAASNGVVHVIDAVLVPD